MAFRHILVPVLALAEDEAALRCAARLAAQCDAKAAALIIGLPLASEYAAKPAPLSAVLAELANGAIAGADQERARILAWFEHAPVPFETCTLADLGAVVHREALAHARLTDLVLMTRASETRRVHRALLEHFLFGAGRPVLLMPSDCRAEHVGERILIGWKPCKEAVRAVNDALPFLKRAEAVIVATIDAAPSPAGYRDPPGADLAAHLARHGVRAEVRNLASRGRTEGRALLDEALAAQSDLIVMGAYGRSRAAEMLFGGVTRELIARAPLPLFLSH